MENFFYTLAEYRALLPVGTTLDNPQHYDVVTYEDLKHINEIAPEETYVCGPRPTLSAIYNWSKDDPSLPSIESKLCGEEHYLLHRKTSKKLTTTMLHLC